MSDNEDKGSDGASPSKKPKSSTSQIVPASPSLRKNQTLLDEAGSLIDSVIYSPQMDQLNTCTLKDLEPTNTSFLLHLHAQFKYKLYHTSNNHTVGKFIVYDDAGQCANLVCYGEPSIGNIYDQIEEEDYVELSHGKIQEANKIYSLCNTQYDIVVTGKTKIAKLPTPDEPFLPPFNPISIKDIIAKPKSDTTFDCVGYLENKPEVLQGITGPLRASVRISDLTGSVMLTAWGKPAVTSVVASSLHPNQRVFAFLRLKRREYQGAVHLYLNEGAEILEDIENERFQDLKNHHQPGGELFVV